MKFINYLESITGIGIFPMVSLMIFFTFFSIMTIWAFRADKNFISSMKKLPLTEGDNF